MNAQDIRGRESFEAWLEARPRATRRQEAVALAHRAAMRVAPLLRHQGNLSRSQHPKLLKSALWANTIPRIERSLPSRERDAAFAGAFYAAAFAGAFDAADAVAVRAAVHAAAADDAAAAAAEAADAAAAFAGATDAIGGMWEEIRRDASALESEGDVLALMEEPLWPTPPNWWQTEHQAFQQFLRGPDLAKYGFEIWIEWYAAAATGKPIFGIRNREIRETLERNIALGSTVGKFNEDFWKREPAPINADITRWVEAGRAQDAVLDKIFNDFDKDEDDISERIEDKDFISRAASVETVVRDGKVTLATEDPETDLAPATAEAAAADLVKGLNSLADAAEDAQADRRIVAYLREAANTISQAVHDQQMLFESGRNQKTLQNYSETVSAEWSNFLASQFHALVAQFAQTLNRFEAWREFVANPVHSAEATSPEELAGNVEAVVAAIDGHKAAFADVVLSRLHAITRRFRQAIASTQLDSPSHPLSTQVPEALQSDLAVSLSNVLLSYTQNGLMHFGVKIGEGVVGALDKGAMALGYLTVLAAIGGAIIYLEKKYPDLFGTVKKAIAALRKHIKDTEPD